MSIDSLFNLGQKWWKKHASLKKNIKSFMIKMSKNEIKAH